jgi:hypothetical protein
MTRVSTRRIPNYWPVPSAVFRHHGTGAPMYRKQASLAALRAAAPQPRPDSSFEPRQRVGVDPNTSGENVVDGCPIDARPTCNLDDSQLALVQDVAQPSCDLAELAGSSRCLSGDSAVGERVEPVAWSSQRTLTTWHHPLLYHDANLTQGVANARSTRQNEGYNPHLPGASAMWGDNLDREVGDRVHRLIAMLVTADDPFTAINSTTRQLLKERPVSGARLGSVRMRVGSAAGTYLRRFRPDAELVGVEEPLGAGVADLVWRHKPSGAFVVDEIKLGCGDTSGSGLIAQISRLIDGGSARWGAEFVGVRVVPLTRPVNCCLVVSHCGDHLVTEALPAWLEVR